MAFDSRVPKSLQQKQEWFAGIITQPIDDNSQINPFAPSGEPIEEEAAKFIRPSPTLKAEKRIQIYNQQFWWRLLNTLHESFPLATRLLGYKNFNHEIAFPYVQKYLPDHWSLSFLGNRIVQWAKESYLGEDKNLVLDALEIDWINSYSFIAPHYPSLGSESPDQDFEKLLQETVYLQPHLFLLSKSYSLFDWRKKILEQDPDYWLDHEIPKFPDNKTHYFVFFRTRGNFLDFHEIDSFEYALLDKFRGGNKIETIIEWIEEQDENFTNAASESLSHWLQNWIANQWLTPHSK